MVVVARGGVVVVDDAGETVVTEDDDELEVFGLILNPRLGDIGPLKLKSFGSRFGRNRKINQSSAAATSLVTLMVQA